jgi:AraC-like DNA-binding protein
MVSHRCTMMVKEQLNLLGLHPVGITLGEVELTRDITIEKRDQIREALLESGLELMDDKKAILIEKIKNVIREMIHHSDVLPKTNFSDYLSQKLDYDYTYLANLFSEAAGVTIEQFIIIHRIERAKELIIYNEYNLTEIAYKMHYSSVAHLSNQFKKVTGLTPSFFKSLKRNKRTALENV